MPIVKNPEDYTMPPPRPQRHIDDSNWIIESINELTEKYPDMWIFAPQAKKIRVLPASIRLRTICTNSVPNAGRRN